MRRKSQHTENPADINGKIVLMFEAFGEKIRQHVFASFFSALKYFLYSV
jgi:hypothetical protein